MTRDEWKRLAARSRILPFLMGTPRVRHAGCDVVLVDGLRRWLYLLVTFPIAAGCGAFLAYCLLSNDQSLTLIGGLISGVDPDDFGGGGDRGRAPLPNPPDRTVWNSGGPLGAISVLAAPSARVGHCPLPEWETVLLGAVRGAPQCRRAGIQREPAGPPRGEDQRQ